MNYILLGESRVRVNIVENYHNKPTIVFLHDSLGCIETWRGFPIELAKAARCNILIYDRLGHGKSDPLITTKGHKYLFEEAEFLDKLLVASGIKKVIIFGHSDGGTIGLIEASNNHERTLGVITEAAHVFVEPITLNGIQEAIKKYKKKDLRDKLIKYHGAKAETLFSSWTDVWLNQKFYNWNITPILENVRCPCLVIQGENDQFGTTNQVDTIVSKTLGKTIPLIVPNVGHSPHRDATKTTINQSAKFIRSILSENGIK